MTSVKEFFSVKPQFTAGASSIDQIPCDLRIPEVAFVGRSNVGKSSLINAVVGDKSCARVSKSPGRTQQINFFTISNKISIADLPGYGYAAVSKKMRKSWDNLILNYLKGRPNLRRVFLLIDSRRGLKDADEEIADILDEQAVVYQIILTKIDKISRNLDVKEKIVSKISTRSAAFSEILATSSEKMIGILELQKTIATFC